MEREPEKKHLEFLKHTRSPQRKESSYEVRKVIDVKVEFSGNNFAVVLCSQIKSFQWMSVIINKMDSKSQIDMIA